ncbi:MAG: hypothetical protein IKW92_09980 [Firmicutes bacterium]|nr:hypothetical protein [Bacillota bacterium]
MKRIISLALVLVLFCITTIPTYAMEEASWCLENEVRLDDAHTLSFQEDGVFVKFDLYQDGDLIQSAILDRMQGIISTVGYEDSRIIYSDIMMVDVMNKLLKDPPLRPNPETYDGTITYQYYVQGSPFSRTLSVSHINTDSTVSYNTMGHFQNFVTYVAFICQVLAFLPGIGALVAADILAGFGVALDATSFWIPDNYTSSQENKVTWFARNGSTTGHFTGTRNRVSCSVFPWTNYYDGTYYAVSQYNSHVIGLAEALKNCINLYWGDGGFSVLSWN